MYWLFSLCTRRCSPCHHLPCVCSACFSDFWVSLSLLWVRVSLPWTADVFSGLVSLIEDIVSKTETKLALSLFCIICHQVLCPLKSEIFLCLPFAAYILTEILLVAFHTFFYFQLKFQLLAFTWGLYASAMSLYFPQVAASHFHLLCTSFFAFELCHVFSVHLCWPSYVITRLSPNRKGLLSLKIC